MSAVTATVTAEPAEDLTALLPFLTVTEKDEAETEASVPLRWNRRQPSLVVVEAAVVAVVPVVVEPPESSASANDAPAPATASARKSALSFMGRCASRRLRCFGSPIGRKDAGGAANLRRAPGNHPFE